MLSALTARAAHVTGTQAPSGGQQHVLHRPQRSRGQRGSWHSRAGAHLQSSRWMMHSMKHKLHATSLSGGAELAAAGGCPACSTSACSPVPWPAHPQTPPRCWPARAGTLCGFAPSDGGFAVHYPTMPSRCVSEHASPPRAGLPACTYLGDERRMLILPIVQRPDEAAVVLDTHSRVPSVRVDGSELRHRSGTHPVADVVVRPVCAAHLDSGGVPPRPAELQRESAHRVSALRSCSPACTGCLVSADLAQAQQQSQGPAHPVVDQEDDGGHMIPEHGGHILRHTYRHWAGSLPELSACSGSRCRAASIHSCALKASGACAACTPEQ